MDDQYNSQIHISVIHTMQKSVKNSFKNFIEAVQYFFHFE